MTLTPTGGKASDIGHSPPRRVLRLDGMPGTGPQCGGAEGDDRHEANRSNRCARRAAEHVRGVVTATPALAEGRGDGWQFLDFFPGFDSTNCGFLVHATQDVDKVFVKELKTTDGSTIFLFTGAAKITFTNPANGKSVTVNTSGPAKVTFNADGSSSFRSTGRGPADLSPAEQRLTGLPGMFATAGPVTGTVDANNNLTSLNVNHILVNICAALS